MTGGAHIRTLAANEARALLPAWAACVVTASVAALTRGDVHQFSQFAFSAATIALGAQSIGHEYAHRTLDVTLMLPVGRRRLFLVKLAVAAALVVPLAAVAWMLGLFVKVPTLPPWLIAAIALCLAPTLTMLCRSQLAGTIFSMSVTWIVLIAVLVVIDAPRGIGDSDPAVLATWIRVVAAVLASSAALGWWLFLRLEAIDGRATGSHVTWWTRAGDGGESAHPLWQLVKKEWRLQQMTFAVTAMYVAACTAANVFHVPGPDPHVSFIGAVTVVYALGVPALIGSLATAEERQLGTLDWQLQLPIPVWQQWVVKAVATFSLSLLLSSGLPSLLVAVFWPSERAFVGMSPIVPIVTTAVSLYASSVCASAVRAAVTSVVAVPLALWLILLVGRFRGHEGTFVVLLAAGALLLVFAFFNHRPEQPTAARIARQTLSIAALVAVGLVILGAARF